MGDPAPIDESARSEFIRRLGAVRALLSDRSTVRQVGKPSKVEYNDLAEIHIVRKPHHSVKILFDWVHGRDL
jgi:hypothetical protein